MWVTREAGAYLAGPLLQQCSYCIFAKWCHTYLNWNVNSLAPGKFEWNFRHVIFKKILVIDVWDISCEIALIWMTLDLTDDQSTLVQVMAWCRQAISHYLSQCWPRSLSPYGVIRPQWVKSISCSVSDIVVKLRCLTSQRPTQPNLCPVSVCHPTMNPRPTTTMSGWLCLMIRYEQGR